MLIRCDGGPAIARAVWFPPPLEISVAANVYVLVDDGPPEHRTYDNASDILGPARSAGFSGAPPLPCRRTESISAVHRHRIVLCRSTACHRRPLRNVVVSSREVFHG
jgi:hypothetical protein